MRVSCQGSSRPDPAELCAISKAHVEIGHLQLLSVFCSVIIRCIRKIIKSYLENIGLTACLIKSITGMVREFSRTNYI